ncbi:Crp/Fnr family transcriptional regulator [Spirulina sp. 06S082]|uniref:Crp/Fnr family transcriptional regulator n=1 Tax=Spirulina sp. 06S082 TaxID=3110248 RepID=UPI003A4D776D
MAKAQSVPTPTLATICDRVFPFRGMTPTTLAAYFPTNSLTVETLFSNRPIYTAFLPNTYLDSLYVVLNEGLIITRSTPLDRIVSLTYPGSCFGMRNLPFSHGQATRAFPSLVEAYKTAQVVKLPLAAMEAIYHEDDEFRDRYDYLFELRIKFQYHLLNCSTYPPQAVAALLRALIYQERELGNQPNPDGIYSFDLPIDVIARACQLNSRTVEQVLKGLQKEGFLTKPPKDATTEDGVYVANPNGLKEVYSATRDKVAWWPLR